MTLRVGRGSFWGGNKMRFHEAPWRGLEIPFSTHGDISPLPRVVRAGYHLPQPPPPAQSCIVDPSITTSFIISRTTHCAPRWDELPRFQSSDVKAQGYPPTTPSIVFTILGPQAFHSKGSGLLRLPSQGPGFIVRITWVPPYSSLGSLWGGVGQSSTVSG